MNQFTQVLTISEVAQLYGCQILYKKQMIHQPKHAILDGKTLHILSKMETFTSDPIEGFKPQLRPMSTLTELEQEKWKALCDGPRDTDEQIALTEARAHAYLVSLFIDVHGWIEKEWAVKL